MSGIGVNLRVTGHCNQGGRKYMEDMFSVAYQQTVDLKDLEYAFFGIFDGHGGPEAATYTKEHLLDSIVSQKAFWSDRDEDVLRAIREGYISTHYTMWKVREKWPTNSSGLLSTSGTTATIAFIMKSKIYIGHVGDSGIVLGYQEENEETWQAQLLTRDHKPESFSEKRRIHLCGGKVIVKAGVPRVVWNRPRVGHKGPVRRSTPIDEIPFLAVSRSLGDFWSYNPEYDKFVVSPEPDVSVFPVDPRKHRCLIFGTDGLWNVMTPRYAVQTVQLTEIQNEKHVLNSPNQNQNQYHPEWINPSKNLVDEALFGWSMKNLRADNTSVVTLMLDPPGPPRAQVLISQLKRKYFTNKIPVNGIEDETGSKICGSRMNTYPHSSNAMPQELSDANLPAVPPSGSVALFTHYGSNQCSPPWAMNQPSSSDFSSPWSANKSSTSNSVLKEDLDFSIVNHERILENSSPEKLNDSSSSSSCKPVSSPRSPTSDEKNQSCDPVQINEVSSSSPVKSKTRETKEKLVCENRVASSFKRRSNNSSNTSHSSSILKRKRLNENVKDDEITGNNSDVENERSHWQSTSESTSNSVKRRKVKKSSADWERTSHTLLSPITSAGRAIAVKKPARSIQTTTRTLRSDTTAATPVRTLRSRNVDLSSFSRHQQDFTHPSKCSKVLDLTSQKSSALPKTGIFSRTAENVHCVTSSHILKRSASLSPSHGVLTASKYSKPSSSSNLPLSAKRLPRLTKHLDTSRLCMKTRSHVTRRIIK